MNTAWHRGVRDLLAWVLGDRTDSPLSGRDVGLPAVYDLTYEEAAAEDVIAQVRDDGLPPQYGEAIQATITWLSGESTTRPADSPYQG
jgi:hypothetical protein